MTKRSIFFAVALALLASAVWAHGGSYRGPSWPPGPSPVPPFPVTPEPRITPTPQLPPGGGTTTPQPDPLPKPPTLNPGGTSPSGAGRYGPDDNFVGFGQNLYAPLRN